MHIDLHWHLHYSEQDRRPFAFPIEAMIDRSRRVPVSGVEHPDARPGGHAPHPRLPRRPQRRPPTDVVQGRRALRRRRPPGPRRARPAGPGVPLRGPRRPDPQPRPVPARRPDPARRRARPDAARRCASPTTWPPASRTRCSSTSARPSRVGSPARCGHRSPAASSAVPAAGRPLAAPDLFPPPPNETDDSGREGQLPPRRGRRRSARDRRTGRAASLRTIKLAISLVWDAGRRQLLSSIIGASVVTSLAIAGQLLVGRSLLDLLADDRNVSAGELAPYLVLLGVLLMVVGVQPGRRRRAAAPARRAGLPPDDGRDPRRRHRGRPRDLRELRLPRSPAAGPPGRRRPVGGGRVRHRDDRLDPRRDDRRGRRPVHGRADPVPIALLGYVPIAVVNVRNNRARYQLELELTELQRDRSYLEYLMTERVEAKEVALVRHRRRRCVGGTPRSGTRGSIALRDLVRKRLALTTIGAVRHHRRCSSPRSSIALILAARGSITIGDAAVAIVGLQQLSGRLQSAGAAFGAVHEGVTFLRDFEAFRAHAAGDPRAPADGRRRRPRRRCSTVEHVGYRYPGAPSMPSATSASSCAVARCMAIVGANGSGKTTLPSCCASSCRRPRDASRWDGVDLAGVRPGAGAGPDRPGVPGLRAVHAHDPPGHRAGRRRAPRRRGRASVTRSLTGRASTT